MNSHPTPSATVARPTLSVVVVNYHTWGEVVAQAEALAADPAFARGDCELVVVDNATLTREAGAEILDRDGTRLIRRSTNDGFAAGVNEARRAARGRWLLLLNPDVVVGPGLVSGVLDRIASHETAPAGPPGIVGFALRNPDGSPQPSVGRFPSLAGCLREALLPRSRRKYQADRGIRPGPVPWVTGACLLARADVLAQVGGLDEDFFLYHEEVALCRRAWDLGYRVEFDPSLAVVHLRPLQNRPVPAPMRVVTRHSKLLYFRKHLPRWQFEGLALIVGVEGLLRGVLGAWRRRPEEQRAWRIVRTLPSTVRGPILLRGRSVRELADTVAAPSPASRPSTRRLTSTHPTLRGRTRRG